MSSQSEQVHTARRSFVARLLTGTAALAVAAGTPRTLLGEAPQRPVDTDAQREDWMRSLTGKHRTAFDMSAHKNGKPLGQAKNFLDAWRDAYKVPERDINLLVGIHGEGIPVVLTDSLWSRYRIGEQYEVMDAGTKTPSMKNPFIAANAAASGLLTPEQSVESLQKRGVRFLVCMNTIAAATKKLSGAGLGSPEEVHAAIMGGLLPGVITVPSMVVTLSQLQERGIKYIKIA